MKRVYNILLILGALTLLVAGPALGSGGYTSGGTVPTGKAAEAAAMEKTHSEGAVLSLNSDQIRELQRLLTEKGYKVEGTEGVIEESTTAAIRKFQTDHGLAVNGLTDEATLRALAPDLKKQEFFGIAPAYGEPETMKKGY